MSLATQAGQFPYNLSPLTQSLTLYEVVIFKEVYCMQNAGSNILP